MAPAAGAPGSGAKLPGAKGVDTVMHRRPILASAVVLAALALPTTASAAIIEVGKAGPAATPSCPKPCYAINHTTGFQSRVAGTAGTMTDPAGRAHRRLDDLAGRARQEAGRLLQPHAGRPVDGADHGPAARHEGAPARDGPGRAAAADAVLRHHGPVPAPADDRRQEGLDRRAHRPDLGAGARGRPGREHRLAGGPPEGLLRRDADPDGPDGDRPARAVLVPVPDGAADLQRDADPDAEAAQGQGAEEEEAAPRASSPGRRPGCPGRTG